MRSKQCLYSKVIVFLAVALLSACSTSSIGESSSQTISQSDDNSSTVVSEDSSSNSSISSSEGVEENKKFGINETILHAWNWSMDNIITQLDEIKKAGYTAIQTSPMQPQKDYYPNGSYKDQWWKLYQPLGFSIAQNNHSLGNKQDLANLCEEADKRDIKIIVDIVSNHLAGGTTKSFHSDVQKYEPDIYSNHLLHGNDFYVDDSSIEKVTKGNLGGYPDLQTESPVVQNRVLSLLKEYVDIGVDGFRFDAAKHIETDEDGEYSSNYWEYVIGGINDYAKSLGVDQPFVYGEILNTVGEGRTYEAYTKRISITDNSTSSLVLSGVVNKNANDAAYDSYITEQAASKIVLWSESHDTFANDNQKTTNINQSLIDKAYVIEASKKDVSVLYFPRPQSPSLKVGDITSYDTWKSNVVSTINCFHNDFASFNQTISDNQGYYVNIRNKNDDYGAVIVDIENECDISNVSLGLPDGEYINKIDDKTYQIVDGHLTSAIDGDIAVLYSLSILENAKPTISIVDDGELFSGDSVSVSIAVSNAEEAFYTINNSTPTYFTNSADVTINYLEGVDEYELFVCASNKNGAVSLFKTYKHSSFEIKDILINNIPSKYIDDVILAWVWGDGISGRWVEGNQLENQFTFDIDQNDTHFLLAVFSSNTSITSVNWGDELAKTNDIVIGSNSMFDASDFNWIDY